MTTEIKTRILAGLAFAQVEAAENNIRSGWLKKHKGIEELAGKLHEASSHVLELAIAGDSPSAILPDSTKMEEALATVIVSCLVMAEERKLHLGPTLVRKLEHDDKLSQLCQAEL